MLKVCLYYTLEWFPAKQLALRATSSSLSDTGQTQVRESLQNVQVQVPCAAWNAQPSMQQQIRRL